MAAAVKAGQLPRSRKEAARQKVLRSAAILAAAHNAIPAAKTVPRKPKGSVLAQQQAAQQRGKLAGKKGSTAGAAAAAAAAAAPAFDVWDEPNEDNDGWTAGLLPNKRQKRGAAPSVRQRQVAAAAGGAIVPVAAGRERARAAVPAVSGWGRGLELFGACLLRPPLTCLEAVHLSTVCLSVQVAVDQRAAPATQTQRCTSITSLHAVFCVHRILRRWRLTPRAAPTTQMRSCTRRRWRLQWQLRTASCWPR